MESTSSADGMGGFPSGQVAVARVKTTHAGMPGEVSRADIRSFASQIELYVGDFEL